VITSGTRLYDRDLAALTAGVARRSLTLRLVWESGRASGGVIPGRCLGRGRMVTGSWLVKPARSAAGRSHLRSHGASIRAGAGPGCRSRAGRCDARTPRRCGRWAMPCRRCSRPGSGDGAVVPRKSSVVGTPKPTPVALPISSCWSRAASYPGSMSIIAIARNVADLDICRFWPVARRR